MDAIRTEGLTKHYSVGFWRSRPYVALDRLNLEVARGEVFGFLGPNGAGKTTTLKLLMQLIILVWTRRNPRAAVGDVSVSGRLGYLPENPFTTTSPPSCCSIGVCFYAALNAASG
jgi:ABC-2 type transport system ATP-binding protein